MDNHLNYANNSGPQWKYNTEYQGSPTKKSGSSSKYPPITHILDEYINDESGKICGEDIERVELAI